MIEPGNIIERDIIKIIPIIIGIILERRLSNFFLITIIFLTLVVVTIVVQSADKSSGAENAVASRFLLTDLCLSTESRHTRNITLIEPVAAFQDAPGFYDHFPSSTFLKPDSLQFPSEIK